jgi:hypothetical protein
MGKGLCKRHYYRQYFQGTTELTTLKTAPDDVRYYAGVDRRTAGECWPWTGTIVSTTGYGQLHWDGQGVSAHIAGWELATGLIAAGFWIDHACHNRDGSCRGLASCLHRRCQNPLHLEAVTPGVNLARSPLTKINQGWVARGASEDEYTALASSWATWASGKIDDEAFTALVITHANARIIPTWRPPDCPLGHRLAGANRIVHPERGTTGCRECMMRTKRFRGHWLLRQD